ncbi:MAG: DinB family protein [Marinoscillum sp.]
MEATALISELNQITQQNMNAAQGFKQLTDEELNRKEHTKSWSILECIEHLNRYGDFYLSEISKRIANTKHQQSATFKSGLLGDYFAKSMLPKEKLNKMKTFKSMNPMGSSLTRSVLDRFIHQQENLLNLLSQAKETNMVKVKTSISISKWIKLRLGDTFRVVVYHNLRHIVQAKKLLGE